jgi:hypothetical protein
MEDGVVNETLNGPLGDLFDQKQLVTDVYGAGNNWSHGYAVYGPQYKDALLEAVSASSLTHNSSYLLFQAVVTDSAAAAYWMICIMYFQNAMLHSFSSEYSSFCDL